MTLGRSRATARCRDTVGAVDRARRRRRDLLALIASWTTRIVRTRSDATPTTRANGHARIADAAASRVRAARLAAVLELRERMNLWIVVDAMDSVHGR